MATFTLHCPCSKHVAFHADEQHIGRQLRCRELGCDRLIEIQRPRATSQSTGTDEQERQTASASEQASSRPQQTSRPSMPAWWWRPHLLVAASIVLVLGGMGA